MARIRDPNRDKAFEIYKAHKGNIDLVEIANQLNVPAGTIRGWKAKDKWDSKLNGAFPKNTERSKRSNTRKIKEERKNNDNEKTNSPNPQARFGNLNAKGNRGGNGGPEGNLKAIKHGAYQNIYLDVLPEEEKELYEQIDPTVELDNEIKLVRLKIARLLNREKTFFYDMFGQKKVVEVKEEDREQGIVICINQLEKLIKTKAAIINDTAKFEYQKQKDEIELEIKLARLELDKAKANMDDDTELEDDGFLDALSAEVESVWQD